MTIGSGVLAYLFIPLTWSWLPVWIGYAIVAGTAGTGCWVVAHECGHRAFTKHNWLQDMIGYCLHSILLVPYFSWQRSHSVHHARTNHLDSGET
ncbi:MAG: fatty acid desaturase, partial [Pelagibacteraceae bacterium TMED259]